MVRFTMSLFFLILIWATIGVVRIYITSSLKHYKATFKKSSCKIGLIYSRVIHLISLLLCKFMYLCILYTCIIFAINCIH